MTTKTMLISVFMIVTLALQEGTARADLISIDINHVNYAGQTASGTVTDCNGDDSLPGQVGLWNELLVGSCAGNLQSPITNQYKISSLLDGAGAATSVSFVLNTSNAAHSVYSDTSAVPDVLHRDWVSVPRDLPPMGWRLSGLEASTLYRLRMFGRELNDAGSAKAATFGKFTATGATADYSFHVQNRNTCDLWVVSTAGGEISGSLVSMLPDASTWSGMQIEWNVEPPDPVVISIDFGSANPVYRGTPAAGTVVDLNGDLRQLKQPRAFLFWRAQKDHLP